MSARPLQSIGTAQKAPEFTHGATHAHCGTEANGVEIPPVPFDLVDRAIAALNSQSNVPPVTPNAANGHSQSAANALGVSAHIALLAMLCHAIIDVMARIAAESGAEVARASIENHSPSDSMPDWLTPEEFGKRRRPRRSSDWVRKRCNEGAIPGAEKKDNFWIIPSAALVKAQATQNSSKGGAPTIGYQRTKFNAVPEDTTRNGDNRQTLNARDEQ
jgi:hypothetical protein